MIAPTPVSPVMARPESPPTATHRRTAVRFDSRAARLTLKVGSQAVLLCLLFEAGTLVTRRLALPVPGNLVGMLLLLALLFSGAVTPSQLQELTTPTLKHLALLFIPYAVGLMNWGSLLSGIGLAILASLLVSAAVGLAVAGAVAERLGRTAGLRDDN